jgi:glutathione S-transferase
MFRYHEFDEIKADSGLRIVLVQGMPSPWGQAAKTIFEVKGLEYKASPWIPFAANEDIVAWGGEASAPIVAWSSEKPVHRWIDILNLAERLAPSPPLVPSDFDERVLMFGLSNEICGELGLGWNRRLQLVAPVIESGKAPEDIRQMSDKYRYNASDVRAAGARIVRSLRALARQLESQYGRGRDFFVGDRLSAVDIYWTAFANLLDPLPPAQCPMPEQWRPGFVASDPEVRALLSSSLLLRHRDTIFARHFRNPMEF